MRCHLIRQISKITFTPFLTSFPSFFFFFKLLFTFLCVCIHWCKFHSYWITLEWLLYVIQYIRFNIVILLKTIKKKKCYMFTEANLEISVRIASWQCERIAVGIDFIKQFLVLLLFFICVIICFKSLFYTNIEKRFTGSQRQQLLMKSGLLRKFKKGIICVATLQDNKCMFRFIPF